MTPKAEGQLARLSKTKQGPQAAETGRVPNKDTAGIRQEHIDTVCSSASPVGDMQTKMCPSARVAKPMLLQKGVGEGTPTLPVEHAEVG